MLFALVGLVGFIAYTRYGRHADHPPGTSLHDARLDAFLTRADERLVIGDLDGAKEQYFKASGLSDKDPRVAQGLARVEIVRTELAWWKWLSLADEEDEERDAAEHGLVQAARGATEAIDHALEKAATDPASTRLQVDRLRVQAMMIYALAYSGKKETAEKSLDQLSVRHRSHPTLEALRRLVDGAGRSREPRDEEEETKPDASADPSAKSKAKGSRVEHFEFDHEPTPPVSVPGELQIPVSPGESKGNPAPVDTSDLH